MQTQFANRLSSNPNWRCLRWLIALLTWLAVPQSALAATFTVTKTADTRRCPLQCRLFAARGHRRRQRRRWCDAIITLPVGTYWSRSGVDNTAANGDLDVTGPLTINGAAQATTIIQVNQQRHGHRPRCSTH